MVALFAKSFSIPFLWFPVIMLQEAICGMGQFDVT